MNIECKNKIELMELTLKQRNYSDKTIKSYLACVENYLNFINSRLFDLNKLSIQRFLLNLKNKNYSPQTMNLHLQAINFFYIQIMMNKEKLNIKCAKRSKKLPVVLSKNEISKIISYTKNPKHRLMISLSYGAGLRVSEVVNLKIRDLDFENNFIHIKESKGKKDRITLLPDIIINDLRNLINGKVADDFVFQSERGGKLTTRTAQKIFQNSCKKVSIPKNVTFHSLRHSFATHLLENGISIRFIQELLGHAKIETTQIYTKVTNLSLKNIKSPL
jgi:integrase/recombinase XerD